MTPPVPFAYATEPLARRHGPLGYESYGDYKPWLRDEFAFRCVYCLERETWYPDRSASFSIDHFEPKVLNPARDREYDNFVYACNRCNSRKQDVVTLPDPTATAFADHLAVGPDGHITARTPEGQDLIDLLRLDEPPALDVRREMLTLLAIKVAQPDNHDIHTLYLSRFGYPADLPDLSRLRPRGGNARPAGIAASHYARRERGELPGVY